MAESASGRPVLPNTIPVAAVLGLVVAAAIAGLLLAGSVGRDDVPTERPARAQQPIAHDGLRLQVPSGWARGHAAAISGFSHPLGLKYAGDGLSAAVQRLPATSATLLPAAFLATLKAAPERPDDLRLASGQRAWRYRFQRRDSSVLVLYAAPTTGGVATVACSIPAIAPGTRSCDALVSTVTVPGSQPLEPGRRAAFFSRLPAIVEKLEAARTKGTRELSAAARSSAQAAAAEGLARAHEAAGAALAPLADQSSGLQTAAVGALTATANGYSALARAARTRAPQAYADARRAVTSADADLRRATVAVAAAGSAASRTATRAANTPVRTPTASTSSGINASFLLLALLGVFALCLAARETLGVLHE